MIFLIEKKIPEKSWDKILGCFVEATKNWQSYWKSLKPFFQFLQGALINFVKCFAIHSFKNVLQKVNFPALCKDKSSRIWKRCI